MGDVAPDVTDYCPWPVWAGDIERLKRRLHPAFMATAEAVQRGACLSQVDQVAWSTFLGEWARVYSEEVTFWTPGTPAICGHIANMATELNAWRAKLRANGCDPGGTDPGALSTGRPGEAIAGVVKWVAIGGVAVAAVYGASLLAPFVTAARRK